MALYVVSDLHIQGPDDPLYSSLLGLIGRPRAEDTLVLAGDVFDLFVGKKKVFLDRYATFFDAIRKACEAGVQVHYIEGNHDFLLKSVFDGLRGFRLYSDEFSLEIGGKKFFFAHGDRVNRADYRYRALRFVFRSIPMKALVGAAPDAWVDGVGKWKSARSRASQVPMDLEKLRKIYRSFAAERMAQGYDFVVMGHCHDLDEMSFVVDGRKGQYVNVGYPRAHGSFLSWSPGDEKILREKLP